MRQKCSFILKTSIALILALMMLVGSISSVIAATVEVADTAADADLAASGWNNTTWYLGNDIANVWDNSASNCTMTKSGTVKFYYDLYLKTTDADVYYRPYEKDNYAMGPTAGKNTKVTTTGTAGAGYNDNRCWYFDTADCTASKYNKIRIWIDTSGNSGNGWSWYEKTAIDNISPTLTVPSTGTVGTAITLTGGSTDTNKIGALTKTYQCSTDGGSTWTDLASGSYTATSTGTVKFRYKVSDAGIKTSGSGTNGRTARVEYSSEQSCTFSAASCDYYTHVMWRDFGGTTYTPDETYGSVLRNTSTAPTADIGTLATSNTFDGWYVGDNGSATSTSGLTKYPDNTNYTNSSISIAYNSTVKHYYAFLTRPEPSYTVTVAKGSGGNVASTSVTAHPSTKVTLPTATPSSGYRFKNWTATSGITITNADSASAAQITATGTGTVTANFETIPGTTIYIKKTMPTFTHFYAWNGANTTAVTAAWPGDKFTSWSTTTDGKYYYKTYTWNVSKFKFILNNGGDSSKTTDSSSYDTGKAYYIDTATAGSAAALEEGVPSAKAITYTSTYASSSDVTWGGTKPATAYPGEEVSFTVSAKSGYKITGVKYNDGTDHNITATSGTYKFNMPSSAVTVTATTVKQYTVTLTAGTGFATKKYKVGSGTQQTYSSAITVVEGSNVVFDVTYTTGYEYDSANSTLDGAVASNSNKTFTLSNITDNKTVNLAAKKITWAGLTAVGKYSTTAENDASYSNAMSPNPVTIAATSATQLDGVAVSAPATDPTGYVFAGWYTTTGSFANAANKDTTFKPNAANAVAIAKYKKIFTITSSVDNTGTGAGTVTVSKNSVEAGGSYNITATAKSGSAVESVKVNDTAKTATAEQTISSVSADQAVVVKFKSNVYLKGTMNSTAWAGDVMQANSAGTTYTKSEVVLEKDTTYQFRHWVDSGGDGTWNSTVDTWTLNNIATHGTSGDNLTIKPSVKAKVTFVSNGTKFTSITAIPYDSTQYNVTLTQSADYTITATYMDVEYTTANKTGNVTVPVYSNTAFSYTVTPASGKYLSGVNQSDNVALTPTFSSTTHANEYTGTISSVSKAFTISATTAGKVTIAAKTNKSSRGTVAVSPTSAAPGDKITITVTPKNGILKSVTYTYAGETTANTPTKTSGLAGVGLAYIFEKIDLAATGADLDLASTGETSTYEFTLAQAKDVTVNATFDSYSAESNYYYYGYDTSGNVLNNYNGKQMTEGMISGEKFSYYQVSGRTGSDQLFKVATKASGTRRFYVETPNATDWNGNDNMRNPYIYWFDNEWGTFEKLTYDSTHGVVDGKKWWYTTNIHEGVGCLIVNMNDSSNGGFKQTKDISAEDVAYGAVWISSGMDGGKYNIGGRFSSNDLPADAGTGATYYSWGDSVYATGTDTAAPYSFGTDGFNDHSQNYAKPKGTGYTDGSYYIVVLYPNTTYTINGVTKTTGNNIDVIWMNDLPGDDENVTVYAKDGSIRSETYGTTYANIANTKIYAADGTTAVGTNHTGNITNQTWETYKAAKGDTIVIKTQIGATDSGNLTDAADLKAKYYVRGFCVNGEVSELLSWNADGLYTMTYKIPASEDITNIEITPIYYLKDTASVTYRVTGFTDELKQIGDGKPNWGDTLYTYPYYGKLGSNNNALGAYPGQPMVYYKGQYQMQIPQKSTAWDIWYDDPNLSGSNNSQKETNVHNTTVSGVTMSNGYYDIVHRQVMGYGSNGASSDHVQTYDYGDFYKIFNEKAPVDNIVFDFKYETTKHNFENQPAATISKSDLDTNYGTNGNGFELLTNFHGRTVDLFGTPLSGDAADPSKTTPVYVISIGGVNGSAGVENIAGYYATEWMVYGSSNGTNYSRITAGDKNSIPPEVLVLNDDDNTSFNTSTYPSADANHTITNWKALYTALEAYRGKPVMISYEAADAQVGAGNYATSGGGGATRNDGRWLYSKNGETITSKIRIDVSENSGATYTPNDELQAPVEGLEAIFTNPEVEGEMTYTTTIDPDKTFDFEAHSHNENYKFMGWYMEDGTKITSDNVSHTERSGSYTFVARFMHFTGGQLILGHKDSTDSTYKGAGTATIAVTVKNGEDETVREFAATSNDITLDDKIINNENAAYTITVTLNAAGTGEDTYARTTCSAANTFFGGQNAYTSMPQTFSFTVGDLFSNNAQTTKKITYNSFFNQVSYTYKYTFNFTARDGSNRSYVREGTLSAAQREAYVTGTGSESRLLTEAFVNKLAPHESNFNQTLTWNITETDRTFTKSDNNYTLTKTLTAVDITPTTAVAPSEGATPAPEPQSTTPIRSTKRYATFNLPYEHTNGLPSDTTVVDKATSTNFVINNINYGAIVKVTGDDEYYITAPRQLNENDTILNFQYWSVKSTKAAGENDPDVARCYFYSFNLVAYDNYVITPVYAEGASPLNSGSNTPITTISYLETSRNQFNGSGENAANDATGRATAADILYNDFVFSYEYNGIDIYKNDSSSAAISKLGYVIERVQKLEVGQDGTPYTDPNHYTNVQAKSESEIEEFVKGSTDNSSALSKYDVAKNSLDNKNRIEFYQAYYNSGGWDKDTQKPDGNYAYKNYVYKAYTYMIVDGEVTLSDPVYFIMYDEATM